jgi:hypothetical protein
MHVVWGLGNHPIVGARRPGMNIFRSHDLSG